jgi:hypothetical protein
MEKYTFTCREIMAVGIDEFIGFVGNTWVNPLTLTLSK